MCEHHTGVDITDGIYMIHIGPHIVIDRYSLGRIIHTGCLKVQAFHIRSASDSHKYVG